jgi:transcriptional regulator of NAD metabolism
MADDRDRKLEEEFKREVQKFKDAGGTYEELLAMLQRAYRVNDNSRIEPEKK